jgi:hypothetical protein
MNTFLLRFAVPIIALAMIGTGCVPVENAALPTPKDVPNTATASPVKVSSKRAVAMFRDVCGTTAAGHFAGARQRMKAYNVTAPSPQGTSTLFSTTEDVSFKITDGPGFGKTCSIVYGSKDTPKIVAETYVANFGASEQSPFGLTAFDRTHKRLVIIGATSRSQDGIFYNLKMFSAGG